MTQKRIAVIGAGGKTTAMIAMAQACKQKHVLVTTTTHMYPLLPGECRLCLKEPSSAELVEALRIPGIVCAGTSAVEGKLGGLPQNVLEQGAKRAEILLYEGDGAHRMPLKLHRSDEPVMLPNTCRCLIVSGFSAVGKPVKDMIHRYALRPCWKENPERLVDLSDMVYCIQEAVTASKQPKNSIRVFLNQEDVLPDSQMAQDLIEELRNQGFKARSGSLQKDAGFLYDWVMDSATTGECL